MALGSSGCAALSPDASLPALAQAIAPPAEYAAWFQRTEGCAGLRGDFGAVEWYVVPGAETFETSEGPKVGLWSRVGGSERIVVAGRYLHHEMVVRHEVLHHLLGKHGHPAEYFTDRCHLTWESWADAD